MDYQSFLNIIKLAITFIVVTHDMTVTANINIDGGFTIRILIYSIKRIIVVPRDLLIVSQPLEVFNFIVKQLTHIVGSVNIHEPTVKTVQTWFEGKYFERS